VTVDSAAAGSSAALRAASAADSRSGPDPHRWWALAIIAVAQLMVVLDASIVTIALPSAQHALHISDANRQWVVTAYTLGFGGLLLLGGRIADYQGRKRMFIVGLLGFAGASALGGIAPDAGLLFAARGLQGAFAALLAPAALSLLTVTFTDPKERARAFGVYGGISGGGAAIGLIAGGLLTEYLSWRWCLLVNVPIALLAAAAAVPFVRESRAKGDNRYDIPGAFLVTTGLIALVYGFTKAEESGWGATSTIVLIVVAAALLIGFVVRELRTSSPLLPMRVVLERSRGGSYLAAFLLGIGLFAMFLFLTYYFQAILHYSALKAGFAFLPFSLGVIVSAGVASSLLPKVGPRVLMTSGLLVGAAGMFWLAGLGVDSSWLARVLPAELAVSLGLGLAFVPLSSTALYGVGDHDAGVASALVNTMNQVGASLGTALLNTIAASATAAYLVSHAGPASAPAGLVHGYVVAFIWGGICLLAAALASFALVRARADEIPTEGVAVG
jgi:EmrB/QacA subfamily drug resistance transporter